MRTGLDTRVFGEILPLLMILFALRTFARMSRWIAWYSFWAGKRRCNSVTFHSSVTTPYASIRARQRRALLGLCTSAPSAPTR
ncbi:hypothetical protein D3C76_1516480 [compost metagenome]